MLTLILLVSLSFPPTALPGVTSTSCSNSLCVLIDACKFNFANRVFTAWNNLPASVFDVMNVDNFKTCLNAVNLSKYCVVVQV